MEDEKTRIINKKRNLTKKIFKNECFRTDFSNVPINCHIIDMFLKHHNYLGICDYMGLIHSSQTNNTQEFIRIFDIIKNNIFFAGIEFGLKYGNDLKPLIVDIAKKIDETFDKELESYMNELNFKIQKNNNVG